MREIKVRVWDKHVKKMGKVTEIRFSNVQETLVKYQYIDDYGKTIDEQSHIDDKGHGVAKLLQYSELKDKNGREFFEGDIITWQDKPIFSDSEKSEKLKDIIVFEDGCFRTKIYNELLSNLARIEKTGFKFNYLAHHETEIIGNIYENPELLEGEEC